MEFIGWMYDIAREQSPCEDVLTEMLQRSRAAGYNAVGLYLEHRFAYASAPWAAGPGCLTPELLRRVRAKLGAGLRLVPFLNTLGHMEGFMRAEGGQWLSEGPTDGWGAQMCATRPECGAFVRGLIEDALAAFDDEWVHLGGDETRQLGQCPQCAARVKAVGAGGLYAEHFGPLCQMVLDRGRRPCLWGDMLLQHPEALPAIPRATVIFDWQYTQRPAKSTAIFRRHGFDVVCCPALQTYFAGWCFLRESQANVDEHAADARAAGALGVLVTTWIATHFSSYDTLLPLIYAAGRRLAAGTDWPAVLATEGGAGYARAAELLGHRIPGISELLKPGSGRQFRDAFVFRANPFYLWQAWRDEACGQVGDEILRLCDEADAALPPGDPLHFAAELHRVAVLWVRLAEHAYRAYAEGRVADAAAALDDGPALLSRLRPGLVRAAERGGSAADLCRLERLVERVQRASVDLRALPAESASRPAFETLTHAGYVPGDQAAWRTAART